MEGFFLLLAHHEFHGRFSPVSQFKNESRKMKQGNFFVFSGASEVQNMGSEDQKQVQNLVVYLMLNLSITILKMKLKMKILIK